MSHLLLAAEESTLLRTETAAVVLLAIAAGVAVKVLTTQKF